MKKVLVLDESGTIDSDYRTEQYFVVGGILYDFDELETIKQKLIPPFENYRKILGVKELKSTLLASGKNHRNLVYGAALAVINSVDELKPIIYVLDKNGSYLIKQYDKKSFKYNKLLEFMIRELISDGFVSKDDELIILLDKIDLSDKEMENIKNWLPSNVKQVEEVAMAPSEEFNFIQAADLIAGIPKLKGTNSRQIKADVKFKILSNCYIRVFPKSKSKDLVDDV